MYMELQHRRSRTDQRHILKHWLKELRHFSLCHLQRIDELIVRLYHIAAHNARRLVRLHNAELRLDALQPLRELSELEVLNAARGGDELDVFEALRKRLAVELIDRRDTVVREPLLYVTVKAAALKEQVTQQRHSFTGEHSGEHTRVKQALSVEYVIADLLPHRLGGYAPALLIDRYYVVLEHRLLITDHQYILRLKRQSSDNTARRQADVRLQRREVYGISVLNG